MHPKCQNSNYYDKKTSFFIEKNEEKREGISLSQRENERYFTFTERKREVFHFHREKMRGISLSKIYR